MECTDAFVLGEPAFEEGRERIIAGLAGEYTREQTAEIPAQWTRFNAQLSEGGVVGRRGNDTWAVVYPHVPMRYVSGVELEPGAATPQGWVAVIVPAQTCAVFTGAGGVASIRSAWMAIFMDWLPKSGRTVAGGPMLERYGEDWMETGRFAILIPLAA